MRSSEVEPREFNASTTKEPSRHALAHNLNYHFSFAPPSAHVTLLCMSLDNGKGVDRRTIVFGSGVIAAAAVLPDHAEAKSRTPQEQEAADKFAKELEEGYMNKYSEQIRVEFPNNNDRSMVLYYTNTQGAKKVFADASVGVTIGSKKSLNATIELFRARIVNDEGSPEE